MLNRIIGKFLDQRQCVRSCNDYNRATRKLFKQQSGESLGNYF